MADFLRIAHTRWSPRLSVLVVGNICPQVLEVAEAPRLAVIRGADQDERDGDCRVIVFFVLRW